MRKLLDRLAKQPIVLSGVAPFVDAYIPRQQRLHGIHEGIVGASAIQHVVAFIQAHAAHAGAPISLSANAGGGRVKY